MKKLMTSVIVASAVAVAAPAYADNEETCTSGVYTVGTNDNTGGSNTAGKQFYIVCSDNTSLAYVAYASNPSSGNCPIYSADTIKEWLSQAELAQASGRQLNIWWNTFNTGSYTCGSGTHVIIGLQSQ